MDYTDLNKLTEFALKYSLTEEPFDEVLQKFYEYMEECEERYIELQSNMYY